MGFSRYTVIGIANTVIHWRLPGLATVVVFSLSTLECGFLLSRRLVFPRPQS